MKQEFIDIVKSTSVSSGPWFLIDWLTKISLAEVIALTMFILQVMYLLRKWWREETEWGLRMKRWSEKHGITKPAPLPDAPTWGKEDHLN